MTKQLQQAVATGVKTNLGISAQKVQFKRPITAELRERGSGMARSQNAQTPKVGHPAVWVPACRRWVPKQGGCGAAGSRGQTNGWPGIIIPLTWRSEKCDKITTKHRNRAQTPRYAGLLNPKEKSSVG